jgi:tetratricopeptide (TPR) repeat protein
MASSSRPSQANAAEIDRLAALFATDRRSKAFMPLADEYIKAEMWEEAIAVLEDGLKAHPGFVTAMVALGRAYEQQGQRQKARAILEEAIKLSPENLRAHRILAKIYAAEGAVSQAQRSCAVILGANPSDEEILSIQRTVAAKQAASVAPAPAEATASAERASAESSDSSPKRAQGVDSVVGQAGRSALVARLESWLQRIQAYRRAAHRADSSSLSSS